MQLGIPEIISKSQRETNYAKYCIHSRGPVTWNSFLNETEKKNIQSQHFFKRNIEEKIFEFEEELSFFLINIE